MRFRKIMIFATLPFVISACGILGDSLGARARLDSRHYPRIVSTLPDGFTPLSIATENTYGLLRTFFWSTNFVIQDSEGVTVFQTDVHDDSFIVIYRNQYYICEEQFSQILDNAMRIYEQLNRTYSVGETMEIRGSYNNRRSTYTITITSVERVEMDTVAVYEINFSIFPSVDSRYIIGFFEAAVLQSGDRLYDFALINDEQVSIEINSTEILDMIVLNIPRELRVFVNQNNTRMVSLQ